MVRGLMAAAVLAVLASCGGNQEHLATKQELKDAELRFKAMLDSKVAEIKGELSAMDQKYPNLLAAETRVGKALEDLAKLQAQVDRDSTQLREMVLDARGDMLRTLEADEKLLTDRLATIREVIEELKIRQCEDPAPESK